MNQTQLYLQKTAAIQTASRHLLRTRQLRKQAGLFSKSYEKPGWENDEDAVNEFAKDYTFNTIYGDYFPDKVIQPAHNIYWKDPAKAHNALNKFNAIWRMNRHSDRSAALVDRYYDLWKGDKNFDLTAKPLSYKGDRYNSLNDLAIDLQYNSNLLPKDKQEKANKLLKDIKSYLNDYTLQKSRGNDYDFKDNYTEVSKKMLAEPLTRKDVGSIADATPKQLETWTRQSKKSPLWETIWPTLTGAAIGAGLGKGTGMLSPHESDHTSPVLPLAGGLVGGLGGLIAGSIRGSRVAREKDYAKRRLAEK